MRPKLLTTLINTLPCPNKPLHLPPTPSPCARRPTLLNASTLPPPSSHKPTPSPHHRTLTTSAPLLKKGGKQDSKRTVPLNASKAASSSSSDAFDFSDYEAAVARAHAHLRSEVGKIRAGGLGPEAVEDVRVSLGKGRGEKVRVGDVASVVVRGRNVGVLVGEKEHLKPILSALQSPPSNLNPTPSPTDPLTLTIPVPPTTAESRRAAQALAAKKGEECAFQLREARGAQRKRLRAMELGRVVGPDELRRAEGELEKRNGEAVGEGRRVVEGCRKGLEGG